MKKIFKFCSTQLNNVLGHCRRFWNPLIKTPPPVQAIEQSVHKAKPKKVKKVNTKDSAEDALVKRFKYLLK